MAAAAATTTTSGKNKAVIQQEHPKYRSIFDLPPSFFDSCRLISSPSSDPNLILSTDSEQNAAANQEEDDAELVPDIAGEERGKETAGATTAASRWTCNTCRSEFESLQDQRSHFKSDVHRLNVKLSIAGKKTIREEDIDEMDSDYLIEDFDVSSISGSEDEFEKGSIPNPGMSGKGREGAKQKLYLRLHSGETISVYRSLVLEESEGLLLENDKSGHVGGGGCSSYVEEFGLIRRLKVLVSEPRDKTRLRIVLLASGGHFAGCVFDGNTVIAHKTFHRYVVRAKAGKKQSAKDGTGKAANSAGSSLRRHNEAALKKEIQELFYTWKTYVESATCIFVYAPAKNRQILFDVEKSQFSLHSRASRQIPLTVHRPTLKEAKRVYNLLTHVAYEEEAKSSSEEVFLSSAGAEGNINQQPLENQLRESLLINETLSGPNSDVESSPLSENITLPPCEQVTTPLHEAAKSGDAHRTLELLEQGNNPCIRDVRGRTPYMVATEKEVRNTFRRYMAFNLDKWDWHAANVPSPLTKEMEEAQAAKQAEKDAKKKAKAKELKKLRKEKEKAKAQGAQAQNASSGTLLGQGSSSQGHGSTLQGQGSALGGQASQPVSTAKKDIYYRGRIIISKEEEQKRALEEEREKRAAAAERRIAALNAQKTTTAAVAPSNSGSTGCTSDVICSCCRSSLEGKIPFHRYNYKYCSTTCMHLHREMLEDG